MKQHLDKIDRDLELTEEAEALSPGAVNVRYGGILSPLTLSLAQTIDQCPKAFPKERVSSGTLRSEAQRLKRLTVAKGMVSALLDRINANMRSTTARLVYHVDRTLIAIDSTLTNPYTDEEVRTQLQHAAMEPLSMVNTRRELIKNAMLTSRAKTAETATAEATAAAHAEEAKRLDKENRFLRGEEMASISLPPAPAAGKTARRSGGGARKTPR